MRKFLLAAATVLLAVLAIAQQTAPKTEKPNPELARQLELRRIVQLEVREQLQQRTLAGGSTGGDMAETRLRMMENEIAGLRREVQSLQQAIWNIQSRQR